MHIRMRKEVLRLEFVQYVFTLPLILVRQQRAYTSNAPLFHTAPQPALPVLLPRFGTKSQTSFMNILVSHREKHILVTFWSNAHSIILFQAGCHLRNSLIPNLRRLLLDRAYSQFVQSEIFLYCSTSSQPQKVQFELVCIIGLNGIANKLYQLDKNPLVKPYLVHWQVVLQSIW